MIIRIKRLADSIIVGISSINIKIIVIRYSTWNYYYVSWIISMEAFPHPSPRAICFHRGTHYCHDEKPTGSHRWNEIVLLNLPSINKANSIPQMSLLWKKSRRREREHGKWNAHWAFLLLYFYIDVLTLVVIASISSRAVGRMPSAASPNKNHSFVNASLSVCVCACVCVCSRSILRRYPNITMSDVRAVLHHKQPIYWYSIFSLSSAIRPRNNIYSHETMMPTEYDVRFHDFSLVLNGKMFTIVSNTKAFANFAFARLSISVCAKMCRIIVRNVCQFFFFFTNGWNCRLRE